MVKKKRRMKEDVIKLPKKEKWYNNEKKSRSILYIIIGLTLILVFLMFLRDLKEQEKFNPETDVCLNVEATNNEDVDSCLNIFWDKDKCIKVKCIEFRPKTQCELGNQRWKEGNILENLKQDGVGECSSPYYHYCYELRKNKFTNEIYEIVTYDYPKSKYLVEYYTINGTICMAR